MRALLLAVFATAILSGAAKAKVVIGGPDGPPVTFMRTDSHGVIQKITVGHALAYPNKDTCDIGLWFDTGVDIPVIRVGRRERALLIFFGSSSADVEPALWIGCTGGGDFPKITFDEAEVPKTWRWQQQKE